jgi:DMSO/TMAO reductase YedYZ heme-binding membrane subunit
MWYLSRSTGIVAAVLAVASLLWGLLFSSRNTGNRRRPNWWLSLHNWLGGLTLGFIGIHMLVSLLDTDAALRFIDLVVPSGAVGWAIGWGVVATWLFALVVLPSVARIRRRLPRKAWHVVHLLALPAVALTAVHAYQAGSDASSITFTRTLALLVGIAVYSLAIRLASLGSRGRPVAAS